MRLGKIQSFSSAHYLMLIKIPTQSTRGDLTFRPVIGGVYVWAARGDATCAGERVPCVSLKGAFSIVGTWEEFLMVLKTFPVFIMLWGTSFIFCRTSMLLLSRANELFLIARSSLILSKLLRRACRAFSASLSFSFSARIEPLISATSWHIWYWGWSRHSSTLGLYVLFSRRVCATLRKSNK